MKNMKKNSTAKAKTKAHLNASTFSQYVTNLPRLSIMKFFKILRLIYMSNVNKHKMFRENFIF